jgi:hypothetical protein
VNKKIKKLLSVLFVTFFIPVIHVCLTSSLEPDPSESEPHRVTAPAGSTKMIRLRLRNTGLIKLRRPKFENIKFGKPFKSNTLKRSRFYK